MSPLLEKVGRVQRKLAWNTLWDGLLRAGFWASLALLVGLVAHRLFAPPFSLWWVAALPGAAAIVAALVLFWRRRPSLIEAATRADHTFGLREILSSALLVRDKDTGVAHALVARAEDRARKLQPARAFPLRPPLEGKLLPLSCAACGLIFLVFPQIDLLGFFARSQRHREDQKHLEETAAELDRRTRRLEERTEKIHAPEARQVVDDMEQVAQMLRRPAADKKEALRKLSELANKIEQQREKDLEQMKDLFRPQVSSETSDSRLTREIRKALKEGGKKKAAKTLLDQLISLKDKFAQKDLSAQDLENMSAQIKSLTNRFKMTPELARKLKALSRSLKQMAQRQEGKNYSTPPPELDFTMEELTELLEKMETEEFLEYAQREIQKTRQSLIKKVKLCPYCKKGVKHPWEGGTPIPGTGPNGEPGVGYI